MENQTKLLTNKNRYNNLLLSATSPCSWETIEIPKSISPHKPRELIVSMLIEPKQGSAAYSFFIEMQKPYRPSRSRRKEKEVQNGNTRKQNKTAN
jgi:hypothetical protein